jgi:hypothetical protein
MSFRRARGHRDWHWFTNCPYSPHQEFDHSPHKPPVGDTCPHCEKLEAEGKGIWRVGYERPDREEWK